MPLQFFGANWHGKMVPTKSSVSILAMRGSCWTRGWTKLELTKAFCSAFVVASKNLIHLPLVS
jgi:hypothetical protein